MRRLGRIAFIVLKALNKHQAADMVSERYEPIAVIAFNDPCRWTEHNPFEFYLKCFSGLGSFLGNTQKSIHKPLVMLIVRSCLNKVEHGEMQIFQRIIILLRFKFGKGFDKPLIGFCDALDWDDERNPAPRVCFPPEKGQIDLNLP